MAMKYNKIQISGIELNKLLSITDHSTLLDEINDLLDLAYDTGYCDCLDEHGL